MKCFDQPLSYWQQGELAWCKLNAGDDDIVVAFNNVMLPSKDICIALKMF